MEDRHRFRVYDRKYREYMQGPFDKTIRAEDGTGFTVFAYKCNHLGSRGITTLFEAMAMPDRFAVEQCTGIKDKNGKLIFEGDIIESKHDKDEVIFDEFGSMFGLRKSKGIFVKSIVELYFEIIGNTHETEV